MNKRLLVSKTLKVKTPAKINLGLWITNTLPNGYHELSSVFLPVGIYDELTFKIVPIKNNCKDIKNYFSLKCYDEKNKLLPELNNDKNLVIKACNLFLSDRKFKNSFYKISIKLKKNIPFGAGLGGGSSDAAATLIALNKLLKANFTDVKLKNMGKKLGADVPFFVAPTPSLVTGIGDKIKPIVAQKFEILILKPKGSVSTPEAYKQFDLMQPIKNIPIFPTSRFLNPISFANLKSFEYNALEEPAFLLCPEVEVLKSKLHSLGAEFALMSGSGSSVFGVFKSHKSALHAKKQLITKTRPVGYRVLNTTTLV